MNQLIMANITTKVRFFINTTEEFECRNLSITITKQRATTGPFELPKTIATKETAYIAILKIL
jgi:hypothetical protein